MGTQVTDMTHEAKELADPIAEGRAEDAAAATIDGAADRPAVEVAAGGTRRARRGKRASEALLGSEGPGAGTDADGAPAGSGAPPIEPSAIAASVEAVLLSTDRPVPPARIADAIAPGVGAQFSVTAASIRGAVELLNESYSREGRSFRVEPVSGGLRIMTRPEHAEVLARFHGQRAHTRLSRAAIESLAIIAYRQPITRAEIESIRGVASGEILKTLMERRLVTITGRAEELGRPMLYGTTRQFLEVFGLATLKDLPPPEEFGLGPATNPPPDR